MNHAADTVDQVRSKQHSRLVFIDRACGLAICLVVYAHILFPETLKIDWYLRSEEFIYKFHMPLFICLSGYLAFMSATNARINSQQAYWRFQRKKLLKFLPVYFLFSLYAILVDIFLQQVTAQDISDYIFSFFFTPTKSSAVFLWYLYILIGFYLVTPFLIKLEGSTQVLLLVIAFLLTNVSLTPLFCFDFFCKFFFFFLGGGLIYKHSDRFFLFLEKNGKWIAMLALVLTIVDFFNYFPIPFQVISLLMIPSFLYVSKLNWSESFSKVIVAIGVSSFAIYLLNTSLINLYFILFRSFLKLEINALFIFSCFLLTVGVAVWIRTVFNRFIPRRVYVL